MSSYLQGVLGSIESLFDKETLNNNSYILLFIAVLLSFHIFSSSQKEKVQLYYKKTSALMETFV